MAIPSVVQGTIETEDGKVFELDSPKGLAWLDSIGSFRYEPTGDSKPYTVRKEASAYWYGCRKVAGKVRKKYIGKSSEISIAKLEKISEALEIPPVPRADKVAEVVEVAQQVTEVAEDRLTALESQVAELLKAVKDLQEALPGKSEARDFEELPKVDNEVVEKLQNELSNLKAENEALKADNGKIKRQYFDLLATSADLVNEMNQEATKELRSQIETLQADREEIKNSAPIAIGVEFPEPATILSKLRGRRKKSKVDLADIEAILEMIE